MSVASKNPFDLLGDDGDSDNAVAPVKAAAQNARGGKQEAPRGAAAPSARRGGFSGNEAAFRDRAAGADRNRVKGTDEAPRGGPRGGSGARVRGGRGSRFPRDRDDRHSKGLPSGSEKQAGQSWGQTEGGAELKDEQAGEVIAKAEQKEEAAEAVAEEPAEPEDKHISYTDYLAQLAEKKLALEETSVSVRKPNEGSKIDKKWASAKPLVKDEDDEFISGSGGKSKRERERKVKQVVEIDNRYVEPERPHSTRGGRGGRGGRGRGEGRGAPRGGAPRDGAPREGAPRGAPRDGAPRGAPRGGAPRGRGGRSEPSLNTSDQQAFPSLGGK